MAIDERPLAQETETALRQTPIQPLAARRRSNAAILTTALAHITLWPAPPQYAPLAVPVRVAERDGVAAYLATQGIFCARHWASRAFLHRKPACSRHAVTALRRQLRRGRDAADRGRDPRRRRTSRA